MKEMGNRKTEISAYAIDLDIVMSRKKRKLETANLFFF